MAGIAAHAAYVPWRRLSRAAIAEAHAWTGVKRAGSGVRAMASWDEDAITMGVEAARTCLAGAAAPRSLTLASTTLPFADRLNAGVAAGALGLDPRVVADDAAGSLRAGVGALARALQYGASSLIVASDRRLAQPMSPQEMQFGDGAAAILTTPDDGLAAFLGSASATVDFVDHYRAAGSRFDYGWEERWVRDEGIRKLAPDTIRRALDDSGVRAEDVAHLLCVTPIASAAKDVARACGIAPERVADVLSGEIGDTGAAHPLLVLSAVLEAAQPGALIVLAAFGQGCDVLVLRTTDAIKAYRPARPLRSQIDSGVTETSYMKHLVLNDLVPWDKGKRAERDKQTALSTLYRNREMLTAFTGGRCKACGARQFPRTRVCVAPGCGARDTQESVSLADATARVVSWSADHLTFTPDPPLRYGVVAFEEGGRLMMEFADCGDGDIDVGVPLRMVFRVKDYDDRRGFRRYFWKAAPRR